jgi:lambda family phage portal protein
MPLTLLDLSEAKRAQLAPAEILPAARTLTPNNMQAVLSGAGAGFGGFAAAKPGRLTADWSRVPRAADQILRMDLRFLRARAREQQINSPIASKFQQMLRTNLVGPHGIRIAFKIEKQRIHGSDTLDDNTNDALKKAWRKWQRKEFCTIHGKYTWNDVCRMAADGIGRDGEIIVRKMYVPKSQNPFGFTLQLIQADQLDDNFNRIGSPKQNQVRMGVEVDRYQKPLAYHLFEGNPYETGYGAADRVPVPAGQIYHFYIPRFIGQTRGYPLLAPVMYDLRMLDGYFEAELVAARSGAMMVGAIESQEGSQGYAGDGETQDGATRLDVENGMLIQLPRGSTLKNVSPEHPTAAFNPFVERSLRLVASGLGVAYHELGNDLAGVNYSSGRLGVLEERDYFMELQNLMIDAICRPVYEDWLRASLLNGALDLPFDPDRYADPDAIEFIPKRWPWVDPLKDSQASVADVQNGFNTHAAILHSHGKDWRDVYKQIAAERAYADELGIQLGTDIRGDALSEVNDGPPEEEGEPGTDSKPAKEQPAAPLAKKKPKK